MRYLLILVVFMMTTPVWAAAFPEHSEQEKLYIQCMSTALTNEDYGECGNAYLDHLDVELNILWQAAYKDREAGRVKTALLNDQRKWIAFKDSSCRFWRAGFAFGTMGRDIEFIGCRSKVIEDRNKFLIEMMSVGLSSVIREPFMSCKDPEITQKCTQASQELQGNDAELNRVWQEIRAKWHADEHYKHAWEALLDEQRKWIAFKESSCQYFLNELIKIDCLSSGTIYRTQKLKELLDFFSDNYNNE